jgi:peroxiredoxin Q/BCP
MDTPADNAAFAARYAFPFPLLCDTDKSLSIGYGAADAGALYPKRVSCLIDEAGRVLRYYPQVSAREHPTEVLRDLAG